MNATFSGAEGGCQAECGSAAAMYKVGTGLPEELRETALGGCAITPTGKALQEKVFGKKEN